MGRAMLIAVLGFIVIFGSVRGNLDKTSEESQLNTSVFTESILARHVTNIAVNYIMSIHSETGVNSQTFSDSNFLDGSYDATIASLGYDSTLDYDTLQISVNGQYGDESHATRVQFVSKSLLVPKISASVSVQTDSIGFGFSGNPQIRGIDTNMDGSTGPGPDLAGLTLSNQADSVRFAAATAGNSTWVQGSPVSEVSTDTPVVNLNNLIAFYAGIADYSYPGETFTSISWGTVDAPAVVYINGDCELEGNSVGYGTLAVNGAFAMRGNSRWYGLILAAGNFYSDVEFTGTARILGAMLIGSAVPEMEFHGTIDIFYSSEAIDMVRLDIENRGLDRRMISEQIWYE